MKTVEIILVVAGIVVMLANIIVSYRVAVSDLLEPHQRIVQCAMIWLLPVLGAGLAYAMMQEPKKGSGSYQSDSPNIGPGDHFNGDYWGSSGGGNDGH